MKFTNTIEVLQSLPVMFSFICDFSNLPQWNYAVIKTEQITDGPVGPGTTFRQQRRFMGRVLNDTFIISEFKTDSIVAIKSIKAAYPFLISYSFTCSGSGVLITNGFELYGGIMNLPGFLFKKRVKNAVAQNLKQLKQLMEKM